MISIYTQINKGQRWLIKYRGTSPIFTCILGFTATALIPHISAAGATKEARKYTALADGEFLSQGFNPQPTYPLPPLKAGASPVLISRAVVENCHIPFYLFNAGLLEQPTSFPAINLDGVAANCVTTGKALPYSRVKHLLQQGLLWGRKLAAQTTGYLIIGECVVGGTTTALAVLEALGYAAAGMVNSSHPQCNHQQKLAIVRQGLKQANLTSQPRLDPLAVVAAVGDPMQIVVAGMAIAASQQKGVMLAGGTQMLAVYALLREINNYYHYQADLAQIVVGTTRWVAEDPTGKTVALSKLIGGVSFLSSDLSFAQAKYPSLQAYEQGYVKEGVGAGAMAIAAHLSFGWTQQQLLEAIESLAGLLPN
ncbi:MAG: TIGR00303 family protein [Cyanobacteria bacterium J083]|nr:MAG: TIGR00303 family protein [Cyanobacteria bacterium J083]